MQIDDTGYDLFSENRKFAVIKIRVSISDMKLVSKALSILNDFKIKSIRDIDLILSQEQTWKEKSLALAIENAKRSAEIAAKTNSLVLGDIIAIEEIVDSKKDKTDEEDDLYGRYSGIRYFEIEPARVQTKLLTEKIKIRKMVKVIFEIK